MSDPLVRVAGVAVAVAIGLIAPRAGAAAPSELRVDYRAPERCPDREAFLQEVSRRVGKGFLPGRDAPTVELQVVVLPLPRGYHASLRSIGSDAISRTLQADTCDELVEGMALVTALALESLRQPGAEAPAPREADASYEREAGDRDDPQADAGDQTGHGPVLAAVFYGGVTSGVAPALTPGGRAGLALFDRSGGPGGQLSGELVRSPYLSVSGASAQFTLVAGRLELWPMRLPVVGFLTFVPSIGFEAGALLASGGANPPRVVETRRAAIPWAALAAAPRLQLGLGPVLIEAGAELRLPVVRHEFTFESPDAIAHEIPAVLWGGFAGLGGKFE